MKTAFNRLVRFKSKDGAIHYGEVTAEEVAVGQTVDIYQGTSPWALQKTEQKAEISEILCPLSEAPLIVGIGLNYKSHVEECGFKAPTHPSVFIKPATALNGPFSDVFCDPTCPQIDYEGELTIVIGKDVKSAKTDEECLDSILAYTVGNDVTSRYWQMPERGSTGYSKGFDTFAPIGPVLVSASVVDLEKIKITTKVNGEVKQNSGLDDMIFGMTEIIKHVSRGVTLRAGTIIMTGTPSGIAYFSKGFMKQDDIVEVNITGIGTIRNKFVFED